MIPPAKQALHQMVECGDQEKETVTGLVCLAAQMAFEVCIIVCLFVCLYYCLFVCLLLEESSSAGHCSIGATNSHVVKFSPNLYCSQVYIHSAPTNH